MSLLNQLLPLLVLLPQMLVEAPPLLLTLWLVLIADVAKPDLLHLRLLVLPAQHLPLDLHTLELPPILEQWIWLLPKKHSLVLLLWLQLLQTEMLFR